MTAPFSVIIPARYASTRLPGKPLLDILGKPMIQRVWEQAQLSSAQRVVIATDDQRIFEAAQGFSAEVVLTSTTHASGTDRLQEVVAALGMADDEIVVNVQGDEPLIPAANIDQVAGLLADSGDAGIATLCEPISAAADVFNPNVVKVVADQNYRALYFSRAPIPWCRADFSATGTLADGAEFQSVHQRHIGIYAYRVSFLHQFVSWPVAQLEAAESLEQLRAMANSVAIVVKEALETPPPGIDTHDDLERVRTILSTGTSH